MTSIYDMYATDHQREVEGFWHPVTDKISFRLARAGGANMGFTKTLEQKTRPHRRQLDDDNMDVALANKLLIETFAETVILDWKGITDANGKKVAYSPAAATKLLTDLPDLFTELRESAAKQANFRIKGIKDDVGN